VVGKWRDIIKDSFHTEGEVIRDMISVLIPVYNTPKHFLVKCLESCLQQTIDDYEIVIVDNGSDNLETIETLGNYSENSKITVHQCSRHENKKNLSVALNHGLSRCKYDLVARMDADDVMLPDRLLLQLIYMKQNPDVDILGGQILIFPTRQQTNHPPIITPELALQSYWFINHPTVVFKREKILDIGGYREEPVYFAEDYELWLRALGAGYQIHNLGETVVHYNLHPYNLTATTESYPDASRIREEARQQLAEKRRIQ